MAQMHETAAYPALCAIAANGDRIYDLIGDGVTEDLPCILTRIFDGDLGLLRVLIEAVNADEFARDAGFDALTPLVEDIFDRGWSDRSVMDYSDFHEDLAAAKQAAKLTDTFRWNETGLDEGAAHLAG